MGDRVYCSLGLYGSATSAALLALAAVIENQCYGNARELGMLARGEAEDTGVAFADFDEVNYAQMPEELVEALKKMPGVSWSWRWAPGADYNAGVKIFHAETGEEVEYTCDAEGNFTFTLTDLTNPATARAVLEDARKWDRWMCTTKLLLRTDMPDDLQAKADDVITAIQRLPTSEERQDMAKQFARAITGATHYTDEAVEEDRRV